MADPKSALTFSQADADEVYDELRTQHVDLDADPLAYGPKRLNKKVSQVRGMLDRCERIFLDVAQRLHRAKRGFRITSTTLELAKKNLFANDPETRAGRSVGDREAIATGKLKTEVVKVNQLELLVQDLEAVLLVVKAKRSDLRDTQGRLRDQIRLCQEEIGLGNRWGSKPPNGSGPDLNPSTVDGTSDIDDMLSGVDGEIHLGAQDGDWEDPEEFEFEPSEDDSDDDEPEEEPETDEPETDEPETDEPPAPPKPEADEPTADEQDEPADPEEALPPTSSTDEVESFLDEPEPEADKGKQKTKPQPQSLDSNGLDIEEILSSFEKPD